MRLSTAFVSSDYQWEVGIRLCLFLSLLNKLIKVSECFVVPYEILLFEVFNVFVLHMIKVCFDQIKRTGLVLSLLIGACHALALK